MATASRDCPETERQEPGLVKPSPPRRICRRDPLSKAVRSQALCTRALTLVPATTIGNARHPMELRGRGRSQSRSSHYGRRDSSRSGSDQVRLGGIAQHPRGRTQGSRAQILSTHAHITLTHAPAFDDRSQKSVRYAEPGKRKTPGHRPGVGALASAHEGIRTPNLLIRSQGIDKYLDIAYWHPSMSCAVSAEPTRLVGVRTRRMVSVVNATCVITPSSHQGWKNLRRTLSGGVMSPRAGEPLRLPRRHQSITVAGSGCPAGLWRSPRNRCPGAARSSGAARR